MMETKRVHFSCDEKVFEKLESLKHLLGVKRDKILEQAISDRFKEVIASIAVTEGLLENHPEILLERSCFDEKNHPGVFDDICEKLSLKGDDGQASSINSIQLEIKNSRIDEE